MIACRVIFCMFLNIATILRLQIRTKMFVRYTNEKTFGIFCFLCGESDMNPRKKVVEIKLSSRGLGQTSLALK